MAKLTVSLAQMRLFYGEPKRNIIAAEKLIAMAAQRKANLIVLPELWTTGYDLANSKQHASELNKGTFSQLSQWATQYKIAITGSILEKRGLDVNNSAPLFAPNGRMMGVYRKLHLFELMAEDKWLAPGNASLVMDLPWGQTGIAICYDLRFPELFRKYAADDGAKLIVVPAEWPLARVDHWRNLLIARAIENQCYIIATNAAGEIGDTVFGGHSMIVDPWGKIVVEAGETPQLITADIELSLVDEVRQKIPVLRDRRPEIYGG